MDFEAIQSVYYALNDESIENSNLKTINFGNSLYEALLYTIIEQ